MSAITTENEGLRKKLMVMTAIDEENVELMGKIDVSEIKVFIRYVYLTAISPTMRLYTS